MAVRPSGCYRREASARACAARRRERAATARAGERPLAAAEEDGAVGQNISHRPGRHRPSMGTLSWKIP